MCYNSAKVEYTLLNSGGFAVLPRGKTFVLFENLGEITAFPKAAIHANIGNGQGGAVQ